ncbi:hypothetical protein ACTXI9_01485 [Brachybacterium alimentarium]|uniref:hypothetical protein n=1 Tax=Brachybacterium alimentarium TaxID=47845 RepID=UPI003FCFE390
MHKWSDSPIVTFSRNGQELTLGRSGDAPVLHLNGSEGLGIAPVEIAKSERIAGDGSIVRGVRYGDRELFIPIFVEQPSTGDLNLWRRELNRLLAPVPGDPDASLVDVQIEDPTTGTIRIARGIYTGGLEGDFGSDYFGNWQTLGVRFDCPDPWWLGPERIKTMQINPGSKPFLSRGTVERENLATNPSFASLDAQFGAGSITESGGASLSISNAWSASGSTSLRIGPGSTTSSAALLMPYSGPDVRAGGLAGKTVTVSLDMCLLEAQTGSIHSTLPRAIGVGTVDSAGVASAPTENWSTPAPNTPGVHRISKTVTVPEDAQGVYVFARNGSTGGTVYVDNLLVEEGETVRQYFDGDSENGSWTGSPHGSTSILVVQGSATPFFPIVLAPSNIVSEYDIPIQGDGDVWPTWEIVGPGRDLTIQRGEERIFIAGEFPAGSVTRIQTRPRRITPDRWDDVSLDSKLFRLRPGPNRLRITMIDAVPDTPDKPGTLVRLVWQERYLEGI